MATSEAFGLKFHNIPIINLRIEFRMMKKYADDLLADYPNFPSDAGPEWLNHRIEIDDELNRQMNRAIASLEAYIKFAVGETLHRRKASSSEKHAAIRNPFSMGKGIGACAAYYDKLPALISPELSLKVVDQALWQKTVELYREVRNPLAHGMVASDIEPQHYAAVIHHIDSLYKWIDSWCLPEWAR